MGRQNLTVEIGRRRQTCFCLTLTFKVHYIPTSSSWLNFVERWFAELSGKAVRRGSFASVPDLIEAIFGFIAQWNEEPSPFVWTAKAEDILAKIERCRQRLEEISLQDAQNRKEG